MCTSLQLQRDNKSAELCISLTCRAVCMTMTFCTSAVCPAKLPHCGSDLPRTSPHASIFCSFQPGCCRPGHGRSRPAEVLLREPGLPAPIQLPSLTTYQAVQEKTKPDSSQGCSVAGGEAMDANCDTKNSDQA